MRYVLSLMAALILGAMIAAATTAHAGSEARSTNNIGRFQIVNPTPTMQRSTFLIDTATGRSWVICTDANGMPSAWCNLALGATSAPPEQTP